MSPSWASTPRPLAGRVAFMVLHVFQEVTVLLWVLTLHDPPGWVWATPTAGDVKAVPDRGGDFVSLAALVLVLASLKWLSSIALVWLFYSAKVLRKAKFVPGVVTAVTRRAPAADAGAGGGATHTARTHARSSNGTATPGNATAAAPLQHNGRRGAADRAAVSARGQGRAATGTRAAAVSTGGGAHGTGSRSSKQAPASGASARDADASATAASAKAGRSRERQASGSAKSGPGRGGGRSDRAAAGGGARGVVVQSNPVGGVPVVVELGEVRASSSVDRNPVEH